MTHSSSRNSFRNLYPRCRIPRERIMETSRGRRSSPRARRAKFTRDSRQIEIRIRSRSPAPSIDSSLITEVLGRCVFESRIPHSRWRKDRDTFAQIYLPGVAERDFLSDASSKLWMTKLWKFMHAFRNPWDKKYLDVRRRHRYSDMYLH